ncbi:hypothetical protein HDV01_004971 [Terramyces sp. JEL0728]|nr:hypothetical protein HDV01_004971 [Terramyces sp. JEL0728]
MINDHDGQWEVFHFWNDIGYDVWADPQIIDYFIRPSGLVYGFCFRLSAFLTLAIAIVAYYLLMSDYRALYKLIGASTIPPLGFLCYDWYNYKTNSDYVAFWTVEIVVLWIVFIGIVGLSTLCLRELSPRIKKDALKPEGLFAMYKFMLLFNVVNIVIWLPFLISDTYFVYVLQTTHDWPGHFYFTYVHPFFSASINMKGFFHAIVLYFGTYERKVKPIVKLPEESEESMVVPQLGASDITAHDGQGSSLDMISMGYQRPVNDAESQFDILHSDKPTLNSPRISVGMDLGNSIAVQSVELDQSKEIPIPSLNLGESLVINSSIY